MSAPATRSFSAPRSGSISGSGSNFTQRNFSPSGPRSGSISGNGSNFTQRNFSSPRQFSGANSGNRSNFTANRANFNNFNRSGAGQATRTNFTSRNFNNTGSLHHFSPNGNWNSKGNFSAGHHGNWHGGNNWSGGNNWHGGNNWSGHHHGNWWGGNRGWYGYGNFGGGGFGFYPWFGWGFGYPFLGWGLGWPYYSGFYGLGYGLGYGGSGGYGYGYPYYGGYTTYAYADNNAAATDQQPAVDQQQPTPSADALAEASEFVSLGEQAFMAGRYADALRDWQHSLVDNPNNGAVVLLMAQAMFAQGQYEAAANTLQMAMQMLPESEWGNVVKNYSQLYPNIQDYTDQIRTAEKARDAKPDDGAIHFLLGYHFGYLNYPKQSVNELNKALDIEPRDVGALKLQNMFAKQAGVPERAAPPEPAAAPGAKPAVPPPPQTQPPQSPDKPGAAATPPGAVDA